METMKMNKTTDDKTTTEVADPLDGVVMCDTINRIEHLKRCKNEALKLLSGGDTQGAVSTILTGLRAHEGTRGVAGLLWPALARAVANRDSREIYNTIAGFNFYT